jgi:hypothetical protein
VPTIQRLSMSFAVIIESNKQCPQSAFPFLNGRWTVPYYEWFSTPRPHRPCERGRAGRPMQTDVGLLWSWSIITHGDAHTHHERCDFFLVLPLSHNLESSWSLSCHPDHRHPTTSSCCSVSYCLQQSIEIWERTPNNSLLQLAYSTVVYVPGTVEWSEFHYKGSFKLRSSPFLHKKYSLLPVVVNEEGHGGVTPH